MPSGGRRHSRIMTMKNFSIQQSEALSDVLNKVCVHKGTEETQTGYTTLAAPLLGLVLNEDLIHR